MSKAKAGMNPVLIDAERDCWPDLLDFHRDGLTDLGVLHWNGPLDLLENRTTNLAIEPGPCSPIL